MKKRLAVFDIDGTIFRSSLIVELVDGLVKEGLFPKEAKKEIERDYIAWLSRKGSYVTYIIKVVEVYQKYIKGINVDKAKTVAKKVIEREREKVYIYTRNLIANLKKENYFLLAISGSPDYIVEEFTKSLGFDGFYGGEYEVKNGLFTGRQLVEVSNSKPEILLRFLKEYGFDLKDTIGIGDSEIDVSFLSLVGNPIAFNPDNVLAKVAKEKKWKIIIERKNVIYELKNFEIFTN